MLDPTLVFIAAVFVVAGIIKGVIGLGLQVVPMGLLVLVMPPIEAAALLVLPAFVTNVWQLLTGPSLAGITRRLWPMMAGLCAGTWAGAGLMSGGHARDATLWLGIALAVYSALGLGAVRFAVPPRHEGWAGPVVGAATGAVTAATGVFVIPAVPYLAALGLDKDDLVQALGLSFLVSTIALAVNLMQAGALKLDIAAPSAGALAMAMVGVTIGQSIRTRIDAATFRFCFFAGLLALGLHLLARSML